MSNLYVVGLPPTTEAWTWTTGDPKTELDSYYISNVMQMKLTMYKATRVNAVTLLLSSIHLLKPSTKKLYKKF